MLVPPHGSSREPSPDSSYQTIADTASFVSTTVVYPRTTFPLSIEETTDTPKDRSHARCYSSSFRHSIHVLFTFFFCTLPGQGCRRQTGLRTRQAASETTASSTQRAGARRGTKEVLTARHCWFSTSEIVPYAASAVQLSRIEAYHLSVVEFNAARERVLFRGQRYSAPMD